MIKPKFAYFQVQSKGRSAHAVKFRELALSKIRREFCAIDRRLSVRKFVVRMKRSIMLVTVQNQPVASWAFHPSARKYPWIPREFPLE